MTTLDSQMARQAEELRRAVGLKDHEGERPDHFPFHPSSPRWTHIALPCSDIGASIEWYEKFTPLELLDRRTDIMGHGAWLGHPDSVENPFILVLVQFLADKGKGPLGLLTPFAHLGMELPSLEAVEEMARRGEEGCCLYMKPTEMPPPVGYICALKDPDGNVIEYSYDQGVYSTARTVWGNGD